MEAEKKSFIKLCIEQEVLCFGDFTLKSGLKSPYFFNAGKLSDGKSMSIAGTCLAAVIANSGMKFDVIFGPAYKGIPLAVTTACALARNHQQTVLFSFNRKEAKDHGEGGDIVGADLQGRVLLVDDVITAGTAVSESYAKITVHRASLCGIVVLLDRQEVVKDGKTSLALMKEQYQVDIVSLISLKDIIDCIEREISGFNRDHLILLQRHYQLNMEKMRS